MWIKARITINKPPLTNVGLELAVMLILGYHEMTALAQHLTLLVAQTYS